MKQIRFLALLCLVAIGAAVAGADPQEQPQIKKSTHPQYPAVLKLAGVEGQAHIKAIVNAEGRVERAETVKTSNPLFGEAAIEAVKQWEFTPAMKDGRPIKAEVIIPFTFKLGEKSYPAKNQGLFDLQESIKRLILGTVDENLRKHIAPEAYATVGNRYEPLLAMIFEKRTSNPLIEGSDAKVELTNTRFNDGEDAAFMTMKTRPGKGGTERFHTVVFMKSKDGTWKIVSWQASK